MHLIFGGNLIAANTLTLFAVMNRASHICGFWFIFLTFCMQRRRILYNHNVTRQKKRSGLWENKPPLFFSPPLWWVYCFASQWRLLYCWALEVHVASDLKFMPRCEVAYVWCSEWIQLWHLSHLQWRRLISLIILNLLEYWKQHLFLCWFFQWGRWSWFFKASCAVIP